MSLGYQLQQLRKRSDRPCSVCGTVTSMYTNQSFCSNKCKQQDARNRKKKEGNK